VTDAAAVKGTVPLSQGEPPRHQEQDMAAPNEQALADARENFAARRYLREQSLAVVVAEARRRADAMSRLDASLRIGMRRPAA
jgi:1,2-phenylacetyl-CoA epoxidase PaaB subunit